MKRKLYILLMSVVGSLVFLTSCNDFLNEKPKGVIIPTKTEDYHKMLATDLIVRVTDNMIVLMTDDIHLYNQDVSGSFFEYTSHLFLDKISQSLYTFEDQIYEDEGSEYTIQFGGYRSIYIYNVVIDQVMDSEGGSQREKEILKGEALVGRAFTYLELVNMYSRAYDKETADKALGMPLELKPTDGGSDLLQGRTRPSLQDNYTQIEKDLFEALDLLNESPNVSKYRASIPAVYGLLARMYLYMGNYPDALKYSELCLGYNSSLLNLNDYNVIDDTSWGARIDVPYGLDSKESVYLRYPSFEQGPTLYNAAYPSDDLVNIYDKDNDRRWQLYYTYNYNEVPTERAVWAPYINLNIGVNTPEVYLIAAESAARTKDMTKALKYLNDLRENRYVTYTEFSASNEDDVLREILDELRRELAFYGLFRFYDLKRLNKDPRFAKTIIHKLEKRDDDLNIIGEEEYKLEPNSYKYSLPIPKEVLRFNPDMQERDME